MTYDAATRTATLDPTAALAEATTYTATVKGGASGVKDSAGNALATDDNWSFSTASPPGPPPDEGPGGPVLVLSRSTAPFSRYYAEILRAEGLNEFTVKDISTVTAATLGAYDVVDRGRLRAHRGAGVDAQPPGSTAAATSWRCGPTSSSRACSG